MPVIICPACDLVHRAAAEQPQRTRCVRCRAILQRDVGGSIDSAIALAATALILFVFSNLYPLVAMNFNGTTRAATLLDTTLGFYRQGHPTLAVIEKRVQHRDERGFQCAHVNVQSRAERDA